MSRPVAVVAGALANKPGNGGEAWVPISWAKGLAGAGFDVHLVEQIDPAVCIDRFGRPRPVEESWNVSWFEEMVRRHAPGGATLLVGDGPTTRGLAWDDLLDLAAEADLLLNLSGNVRSPALLDRFRCKVYLDLDPGWTQVWDSRGLDLGLDDHDLFATVAGNVGRVSCELPLTGRRWIPVRQPVDLDDWRPVARPRRRRLTTVGTLRCPYGPLEVGERILGTKLHELRRFRELAELVDAEMELALAVHPADEGDRQALRDSGWSVVDPKDVAGTPDAFRSYVHGSFAEWSVAQGAYVELRTGWFSDRSVRYLACGRPVVVQDTGLRDLLPTGEGLLVFEDLDGAAAAIAEVLADPRRHSQAARQIAEDWFGANRVVADLLDHVGARVR